MNKKLTTLKLIGATLWGIAALSVQAQPVTPSAQDMIEQLRSPAFAPKLRGLRNLSVESTNAPAAATESTPTSTPSPTAAPSTAAASASVAPTARPALSLLIQFDFNSAQVRPESQQALMNLASALNAPELKDSKFAVEGHTDAKGLADYNLKLSQLRAEAVQAFLVKQGVTLQRLSAAGKGATQLADTAHPMSAENRRVRIVNLD